MYLVIVEKWCPLLVDDCVDDGPCRNDTGCRRQGTVQGIDFGRLFAGLLDIVVGIRNLRIRRITDGKPFCIRKLLKRHQKPPVISPTTSTGYDYC